MKNFRHMKVEKVMYLSPDFNNHNVPTPLVPADYFEANQYLFLKKIRKS